MFSTSSRLRSLNRDKNKISLSKSQATSARSSGVVVNNLKNTIKNNITNTLYVESIDFLISKINNINQGFTNSISEKMTNYNNLQNEVEDKISDERTRLYREEQKWREEKKK